MLGPFLGTMKIRVTVLFIFGLPQGLSGKESACKGPLWEFCMTLGNWEGMFSLDMQGPYTYETKPEGSHSLLENQYWFSIRSPSVCWNPSFIQSRNIVQKSNFPQ